MNAEKNGKKSVEITNEEVLTKAKGVMAGLNTIWNSKQISYKSKLNVLKTCTACQWRNNLAGGPVDILSLGALAH